MKEVRADLHCHTTFSDSSVSPRFLLELAKAAGLSAIAVTDHDTFSGLPEALSAGAELGVRVIRGAEFSTMDYERRRKVHILAYECRTPEALEPVCAYTAGERDRVGRIMLERIRKRYGVPEEMILRYRKGPSLFKQHIMHGLMDAGLADEIFGDTFHRLFGRGEESVSEPIRYPDVYDVLRKIREAGGIAVLAHPALYKSEELMKELIASKKIDGIEAFHESADRESAENYEKAARENGLLVTGGTDFHGMYHKRGVPVGSFTAGERDLEKLLEKCR